MAKLIFHDNTDQKLGLFQDHQPFFSFSGLFGSHGNPEPLIISILPAYMDQAVNVLRHCSDVLPTA